MSIAMSSAFVRSSCPQVIMTLLGLVEETLRGRDQRLVQLCDVPGIVNALEGFGIFDLEMLADNLSKSRTA